MKTPKAIPKGRKLFEKGNKLKQGISSPNSGRKPLLATQFRLDITNDFPKTLAKFQEIRDTCDDTNYVIQACKWLGDQAIGKAKETFEVDAKGFDPLMQIMESKARRANEMAEKAANGNL